MSRHDSRGQYATVDVPTELFQLAAEQRALLLRWVRSEALTRERGVLLKMAQSTKVEQSAMGAVERTDQLCDRLLENGWISRQAKKPGSSLLWDTITWRDLPRLRNLLGLPSVDQLAQARRQKMADAFVWLDTWRATAIDPDLLDELSKSLALLERDQSLTPDRLDKRVTLIKAIAAWHDSGEQGLRRNFALRALKETKALTKAQWHWLGSMFNLERLGISRFAEVAWLAGDITLSWQQRKLELAPLHCIGLPLEDLQRVDRVGGHQRWWLIENRTSFEQRARHLPPGVAVLWMPGRPSHAWMAAVSHLLTLAPAPAWISADADPSGVDIACAVGARWEQAGLAWEPYLMGLAQWEATSQKGWLLNDHDRRLLKVLLARPDLAPELRALCVAMQKAGRKAEQEEWM